MKSKSSVSLGVWRALLPVTLYPATPFPHRTASRRGSPRSIPAMKPALKASPAPVVFRTFTWNASVKNSPSALTVNAPSPPIREITVRPSTAKALTESFQSSLGQKE